MGVLTPESPGPIPPIFYQEKKCGTLYSAYCHAALDNFCNIIDSYVQNNLRIMQQKVILRAYSIIGSRSGFTVNLGSDSLGKSNDQAYLM